MDAITVLGGDSLGGTYVLFVEAVRPLSVRFGGFRGGKRIALPAGCYVYTGSALSHRGGSTLARRLARHATRSGRRPPHRIRKAMVIAALGLDGVDLLPRGEKRLHWHIDYLLDQRSVSLKRVVAIRSPVRLESAVADLLFADPHTAVIETGLGASDAPGSTHLLRVDNDAGWWEGLVKCLEVLLKRQETEET